MGGTADYSTCERVVRITGGLPLYAQNALRIAASAYDGDVARFCDEIESASHLVATAQESILAQAYQALPSEARDASVGRIPMLAPAPA